ncbi:hypothetical protein P20495_2813 [Pseudoalteromonas sp. BSi20495]|nr:hypothetical protein P20495_2813 [Pseudoalteromonas sp. BSi20495]
MGQSVCKGKTRYYLYGSIYGSFCGLMFDEANSPPDSAKQ